MQRAKHHMWHPQEPQERERIYCLQALGGWRWAASWREHACVWEPGAALGGLSLRERPTPKPHAHSVA